jgi:hypothetical protein
VKKVVRAGRPIVHVVQVDEDFLMLDSQLIRAYSVFFFWTLKEYGVRKMMGGG